jgi:lipopolysaccharide/colanic/teichoic acid biosynthesis glycosyltransferase
VIVKRILDISISALLMVLVLSWLIPILALIIVLESKGSPFFIQRRTGLDGSDFNCFKLRTMIPNTESESRQSDEADDRITRFGYFLRLTSLDELPQLWNVLKGDMSLIGPRPHMLSHTRYYSSHIKSYEERHKMRPGLTGLAQVHGWRGSTKTLQSMEKRVAYDLVYVRNWNLWLDAQIYWRTIGIMLTGMVNGIKYRR